MSKLCEYIFGRDGSKEKVIKEEEVDRTMHCKHNKYTSCEVKTESHDVRGNNLDGKFYIHVSPSYKFASMYSSLAITSAEECEALIDCLIDMKDVLS